jgi:hypothetical protein
MAAFLNSNKLWLIGVAAALSGAAAGITADRLYAKMKKEKEAKAGTPKSE